MAQEARKPMFFLNHRMGPSEHTPMPFQKSMQTSNCLREIGERSGVALE